MLTGIFGWRLYVLLFLIVLRPGLPQARLCDVADHDARAMYARISVVMLLIILVRILGQVLSAIHTPPQATGAYQVIAGRDLRLGLRLAGVQLARRRRASGSAASARSRRWPA